MIDIVEVEEKQIEFTPFEITFKLNTRYDAQALHFLFNYPPIFKGIFHLDSDQAIKIRRYLYKKSNYVDLQNPFEIFQKKLTEQINCYANLDMGASTHNSNEHEDSNG